MLKDFKPVILAMPLIAASTYAALAETTKQYEVSGFTEIEISEGVNVSIISGPKHNVTVTAPNTDLIEKLSIKQRGEQLTIKKKKQFSWGLIDWIFQSGSWQNQIDITVTLPELTELKATSGADVELSEFNFGKVELVATSGADLVAKQIRAEKLNLLSTSGASIHISGQCDDTNSEATSGADIDAKNLVCEKGNIEVSSGASIDIGISQNLQAGASSGGSITILGSPEFTKVEESSGGDVSIKN